MDQETIAKAIDNHLNSLEKVFYVALSAAVIFAWAGIQNSSSFTIWGLAVSLNQAFFLAVAFYILINIQILLAFCRLGALIHHLDSTIVAKGITILITHSWIANPFASFGKSRAIRAQSSAGVLLLIVMWWVCNASLFVLAGSMANFIRALLSSCFLLVGLASLLIIDRICGAIINHPALKSDVHSPLASDVKTIQADGRIASLTGIGVGFLLTIFMLVSTSHQSPADITRAISLPQASEPTFYSLGGEPMFALDFQLENEKNRILLSGERLLRLSYIYGVTRDEISAHSPDAPSSAPLTNDALLPASIEAVSSFIVLSSSADSRSTVPSLAFDLEIPSMSVPLSSILVSGVASSAHSSVNKSSASNEIIKQMNADFQFSSQIDRYLEGLSKYLTLMATASERALLKDEIKNSIYQAFLEHSSELTDARIQTIFIQVLREKNIITTADKNRFAEVLRQVKNARTGIPKPAKDVLRQNESTLEKMTVSLYNLAHQHSSSLDPHLRARIDQVLAYSADYLTKRPQK
jgi:hypothetical protein